MEKAIAVLSGVSEIDRGILQELEQKTDDLGVRYDNFLDLLEKLKTAPRRKAEEAKLMVAIKQNSAFDADEAEMRALRDGVSAASAAAYDERLSEELRDVAASDFGDAPFRLPDWEKEEAAQTNLVGSALHVVAQRQRLLGKLYPFSVKDSEISYRGSMDGLYEFLLATSEAVAHSGKKYRRLVRHFERVANILVASYVGHDARACRFGSPSEPYFESLPTNFRCRVDRMRALCGYHEDEWRVSSASLASHLIDKLKDGKIDFVIRRSLGDERPGGFTLVGQCGCGRDDVREESMKHRQVSQEWLGAIFDSKCVPSPKLVFASSQHIADEGQLWQKQLSGDTLIFDRIRLVKLAAMQQTVIPTKHKLWLRILTRFVKDNAPTS